MSSRIYLYPDLTRPVYGSLLLDPRQAKFKKRGSTSPERGAASRLLSSPQFLPHLSPAMHTALPGRGAASMPKKGRCRSTARKPLSDLSNCRKPSMTCRKKKAEVDGDDISFERLAVAHADLSKVISQIDELVVQAFKHKRMNKMGSNEIESFVNYLSDMHSSLKSWVPRFQKAFGGSSVDSGDQAKEALGDKTTPAPFEENSLINDGTEEAGMELVLSPSPLVSWRTGTCTVDSGKQLFLLTPLPKSKATAYKTPGLSKSFVEKFSDKDPPRYSVGLPAPGGSVVDVLETVEVRRETGENISFRATEAERVVEPRFVSPLKVSNNKSRACSIYLLTPSLKSSHTKTHAVLKSITETFPEEGKKVHKSTPWISHGKPQSLDNYSCDVVSKDLASRYPEFFGLQPLPKNPTIQSKAVDGSLDWFLSPPKTCVLMEPSDNNMPLASTSDEFLNEGLSSLKLDFPEKSPLWKDLGSTVQKGRRPGENTLKKELWARFEAVSAPGLRFDASVCPKTSKKGFLDMLEEASCETINGHTESKDV